MNGHIFMHIQSGEGGTPRRAFPYDQDGSESFEAGPNSHRRMMERWDGEGCGMPDYKGTPKEHQKGRILTAGDPSSFPTWF